jgi:Zn-dependent protease
VHLVFWGGATWWLHDKRRVRRLSMRQKLFLAFTARINLFLFIFNILPIPGFDGFQVLRFLIQGVF